MKGLTKYQKEALQRILDVKAKTGAACDFDQLLEGLSWTPSKASAQFTIRAMVDKKLIAKTPLQFRRGRQRVCYEATETGMLAIDPRSPLGESLAKPKVDIPAPVSALADLETEPLPEITGFGDELDALNEVIED